MSGPATHVAGECGFRERQKKENEAMELKKLQVRCDLYPFKLDIALIPSQEERKRKELEREKDEKRGRERKEELEVRCDPYFF